jgi:2,4-dienoyl-CoA reductase-like NADH-dependent reductase (Old Yellow Enzyme family)/thioredoxin reductase
MIGTSTTVEPLFQPLEIRSMRLANRIVLPPMTTLLGAPDGEVSDAFVEFYAARARGGAGLITAETVDVHPYTHNLALGDRGFTAIYDDRFVAGFRRFTDAMHAAGAKTSVQLHHSGNAMVMLDPALPPLGPSAVPHPGGAVPRSLSIEEIEEIVDAFGAGARRAKEAGFDAVDIHGGHGYLIAQFLSPYFNRRTDRYGGTLTGRLRFAIGVIQSVRDAVGEDFPIIFRFSADERVPGGRDVAESVAIAPHLAEAGADCLSITTGMHFTLGYTVAPMGKPRGLNVEAAAAVKAAVDVPVMVVGRLGDPLLAAAVLRSAKADLIAIGRGLIADPELPNKFAAGRFDDVRPCIACNQGCIGSMVRGAPFNCMVNPEAGREVEMRITPAASSRRIFIAGGGPAGMEAARVAALRGHDVTLYEKGERLGGQFHLGSLPPRKQEISTYLAYLESQLKKRGVRVLLGETLTLESVTTQGPDAVIVATGSEPHAVTLPGADAGNVASAQDVLAGKAEVGGSVVVVGGGQVGCETAEFLDRRGRNVTLVEMCDELAPGETMLPRAALLEGLAETRIETLTGTRVVEVLPGEVVVEYDGQRRTLSGVDTVVLAVGVTPVNHLAALLSGTGVEIHVVGDAGGVSNAMVAIESGASVGRRV